MIKKSVFMNNYKYIVEKLYNHPNSIVFVACLNDDPSVILGYSIVSTELDTLHWVYVKKAWRNKGIAKNLVPPTIKTVTHLSRTGLSIYNKRKDLDFNPFKLG
jgi:GNAT superfamily N-acetyltransferase